MEMSEPAKRSEPTVMPGRAPLFYVNLKRTQDVQVHNFQHEVIPYKGKVYCFEVPNHLFVTRRHGKIGIHGNTHATAKAAQNVAEEQVFIPERAAIDEIINSRIVRPDTQLHLQTGLLGLKCPSLQSRGPTTRLSW